MDAVAVGARPSSNDVQAVGRRGDHAAAPFVAADATRVADVAVEQATVGGQSAGRPANEHSLRVRAGEL